MCIIKMKTLLNNIKGKILMPLAFAGIIYGPSYAQGTQKEIVTLNELEGKPKVEKDDSIAIYKLLNSVGKDPKNFYQEDRIIIKDNSVVYLGADNLRLNTLYPSIGKLINLVWLDLGDNQIKKIPKEIGNLKNLNGLYLAGNPPLSQKSIELLEELKKKRIDMWY